MLGDFFLYGLPSPFSTAVQIVVYQGRIVAIDGGRDVIQSREQIFFDVVDIGGILPYSVQRILEAGAAQLQEPGFDYLCRIVVLGNADRLHAGTNSIHHESYQLA